MMMMMMMMMMMITDISKKNTFLHNFKLKTTLVTLYCVQLMAH